MTHTKPQRCLRCAQDTTSSKTRVLEAVDTYSPLQAMLSFFIFEGIKRLKKAIVVG